MPINRDPLCSYFDGMFAREELSPGLLGDLEAARFLEAAAYHEAGHAVLSYVFRRGLTKITLTWERRENGKHWEHIYSGKTYLSKAAIATINRKIHRFVRNGQYAAKASFFLVYPDLIISAAGPAAERKFCLAIGCPIRTLGSSADDHQMIDRIGKIFTGIEGDSYDICDRAWYHAQEMLEDTVIWNTVHQLAAQLTDMLEEEDAWTDPGPGILTVTMPGPRARAIIRRNGVGPGFMV